MKNHDLYRVLKRRAKYALDNAKYYLSKGLIDNAWHERGRLHGYESIVWEIYYKEKNVMEFLPFLKALGKINDKLFNKLIRG